MNKQFLIYAIAPILIILTALGFILKDQTFWFLGAVFFVTYTLGCIGFGFWLGQYSLRTGASLTLEAQKVNDNYDIAKMQHLSRFGGDLIKLAKLQRADPGYPPLLENDTIDGDYVMTGFDESEEMTNE